MSLERGPIEHSRDKKGVALALPAAIQKIPTSVSPAEVFGTHSVSFSNTGSLALADDDPSVLFLILYHGLLMKVEPLLSLAGCKLGGHVPLSFGAFAHVERADSIGYGLGRRFYSGTS